MAAHSQSTGWITTSKPSKSSAFKETVPKLHQSSLHDFIKRKPRTNREKENKGPNTTLKSAKRKQSGAKVYDEEGAVPKKRITLQDAPNRSQDGLANALPRWIKDRGDNLSSPIVLSDDQDVVSWDNTTVWDSATTSRTIRVEPSSCTSKETPNVKKRKTSWTGDRSGQFKVPVSSTTLPHSPEVILAPDTPARDYDLQGDDDPFVDSSPCPRGNFLKSSRQTEIIPSSQSQEMEHVYPHKPLLDIIGPAFQTSDMHFAIPSSPSSVIQSPQVHRPLGIISDEEVPSSQSQYLLPYKASPLRNPPRVDVAGNPASAGADIVPSSQLLEELELKAPSPIRRAWPRQSVVSSSLSSERDTSMTLNEKNMTTPKRPSRIFSMDPPPSSIPELFPRPLPRQMVTLPPSLTSTSPPPMASSQYSYLSDDSSYPPEVKNFFDMVDDNRSSLGSDFCGTSLRQSQEAEAPVNRAVTASPGGLPNVRHLSGSPEPSLDSSLLSESISTQSMLIGHESQYAYVEELCPPVVREFLDMVDQNRESLGTQFQDI